MAIPARNRRNTTARQGRIWPANLYFGVSSGSTLTLTFFRPVVYHDLPPIMQGGDAPISGVQTDSRTVVLTYADPITIDDYFVDVIEPHIISVDGATLMPQILHAPID